MRDNNVPANIRRIYEEMNDRYKFIDFTENGKKDGSKVYNLTMDEVRSEGGGGSVDFANYVYHTYKPLKPQCYLFQIKCGAHKTIGHVTLLFNGECGKCYGMDFVVPELKGTRSYENFDEFVEGVVGPLAHHPNLKPTDKVTSVVITQVYPENRHELNTLATKNMVLCGDKIWDVDLTMSFEKKLEKCLNDIEMCASLFNLAVQPDVESIESRFHVTDRELENMIDNCITALKHDIDLVKTDVIVRMLFLEKQLPRFTVNMETVEKRMVAKAGKVYAIREIYRDAQDRVIPRRIRDKYSGNPDSMMDLIEKLDKVIKRRNMWVGSRSGNMMTYSEAMKKAKEDGINLDPPGELLAKAKRFVEQWSIEGTDLAG